MVKDERREEMLIVSSSRGKAASLAIAVLHLHTPIETVAINSCVHNAQSARCQRLWKVKPVRVVWNLAAVIERIFFIEVFSYKIETVQSSFINQFSAIVSYSPCRSAALLSSCREWQPITHLSGLRNPLSVDFSLALLVVNNSTCGRRMWEEDPNEEQMERKR